MPNILRNIFDLFFPEECLNCGSLQEVQGKFLCIFCLSELPLTHYSRQPKNQLEMAFIGRIPIKAATSLFYFERKGAVQKLIHQLKYQGKSDLGIFFGLWLAHEMAQSNRFEGIDFVIPVPMHPKKEKKRGYNQVMGFASAIAKELKAELRPDVLLKVNNRKTQTSKNRFDRLKILENDYKLHSSGQIENAHILLVDDIITSGATIEACGVQLLKHNGVQLSLASMAFTP